jgi:hypothetical protein
MKPMSMPGETAWIITRWLERPRKESPYFKFRGDGAAAEIHVGVLITVIHLLGDDKLAKVVSQQSVEDREGLRSDIEMGLEHRLPFQPKGYLERNFPKTARMLSRP